MLVELDHILCVITSHIRLLFHLLFFEDSPCKFLLPSCHEGMQHQCHLIKKINTLYDEQVKGLTTYKMSGTPSVGLVRPTDKNEMVSKEDHEQYRTGVGMLMYLIKICNETLQS